MDTYGNGQGFGEFAVAFCREHNIDIDKFYSDIKENPMMFIHGMVDGIGGSRDKKIYIHIEI